MDTGKWWGMVLMQGDISITCRFTFQTAKIFYIDILTLSWDDH